MLNYLKIVAYDANCSSPNEGGNSLWTSGSRQSVVVALQPFWSAIISSTPNPSALDGGEHWMLFSPNDNGTLHSWWCWVKFTSIVGCCCSTFLEASTSKLISIMFQNINLVAICTWCRFSRRSVFFHGFHRCDSSATYRHFCHRSVRSLFYWWRCCGFGFFGFGFVCGIWFCRWLGLSERHFLLQINVFGFNLKKDVFILSYTKSNTILYDRNNHQM